MIYCADCAKDHGWPMTAFQTMGSCEICGREAPCSDEIAGKLLGKNAGPAIEPMSIHSAAEAVMAKVPSIQGLPTELSKRPQISIRILGDVIFFTDDEGGSCCTARAFVSDGLDQAAEGFDTVLEMAHMRLVEWHIGQLTQSTGKSLAQVLELLCEEIKESEPEIRPMHDPEGEDKNLPGQG